MKRRDLNPLRMMARAWAGVRNWRRLRYKEMDYILFPIEGAIPALPEARSWLEKRILGEPPITLWEIDRYFRQIADDPRPKGVILMLRDPELSLADAQTLRTIIERLRAAGKRVIAYAQSYDLGTYLIASVCDEILMQPGGDVSTLGLYQQAVFLKDALAAVGVALDVIAITPYKGVYDQLSRDSISPEARAQQEWLLDSRYTMIVRDIAASRGWEESKVRAMIDGAPYIDQAAVDAGYIDGLVYEEGLPERLGTEDLIEWEDIEKKLVRKPRRYDTDKYIAILPITGLMMPGESGAPPIDLPIPLPIIGGERAGDITVVQQVRGLMKDERVGAVVLYIDSGGGAAIAAEAMTSALQELAKMHPVVAYMNGVAASGGYMVACPAQWIVAQPGTITGSIGVVTAKPVTGGLEEKLLFKSFSFLRGANADLYSSSAPFTDDQRAKVRTAIEYSYRQFIEMVAAARHTTPEAIDAIGGGRVWTGEQGLANGLVDELGDVRAAILKARVLGDLPERTPSVLYSSRKLSGLPPMAAKIIDPAAGVKRLLDNARGVLNGRAQLIMPFEIKHKW